MNATREAGRELDAEIQRQDRLLVLALACHAHPRLLDRLIRTRAELAHQWGQAWSTQPVGE